MRLATLDDLRRLPPPRLVPSRVVVELALPGIADGRRREFERRLAEQLAACGCNEAALAVLACLAAGAGLWLAGSPAPTTAGAWLALLGGLVAASLVGKAIGLALANRRLRRIAAELARALDGRA